MHEAHTESLDLKLRKVERNLSNLYELLSKNPTNQSYLLEVKNSLEDLKEMVESPHCNDEFNNMNSCTCNDLVQSLQSLSMKGFCLLENELTSKTTNKKAIFKKYHDDVENKMFSHAAKAGINDLSKVLVIGCGGFPLSCLVLSTKFNCQVTGIDCDGKAIESALNLKDELSLDSVEFICSRGESYLPKGFTHIVIASLVSNKKEVLDHLFRVVNPEQLILCRYGEGLQQVINYSLESLDQNQWEEQWLEAKAGSMYRTLAIRKVRN